MKEPSAPCSDTCPPPPYTSTFPPVVTHYGTTAMPAAVLQQLQNTPVQVLCPNCHAAIWTVVNYDIGMLTYVISAALCFVGCNLGCCLIPFCIDDCKDAIHTCPICDVEIGRWKHM